MSDPLQGEEPRTPCPASGLAGDGTRVAIVLNHAPREMRTLARLERALVRCDPQSCVRMLEYRDPRFLSEMLEFSPHVVLSFPVTAISTAAPFYALKFLLDCHLVSYRREGVLVPGHDWGLETFVGYESYGPDLIDYEVFWGEELASAVGSELVRRGKLASPDCIRVFGYPDYEVYFGEEEPPPLPPDLEATLRPESPERTVLFVTGFHAADYSDDDVRGAGDLYDPSAPDAEQAFRDAADCMRRTARLREQWIQAIATLAELRPDAHLIVKMHPIETVISERRGLRPYAALDDLDNVRVIHETVPIGALLMRSGLLVHYGSTTAAEACLQGVPAVFTWSDEVLNGSTHHLQFFDSVFPSSDAVEIGGLPDLVMTHLDTPLRFERTPAMHDALRRLFNISGDHYRPSEDMAEFLLSLRPLEPRRIDASHPRLCQAFRSTEMGLRGLTFLLERARREAGRRSLSAGFENTCARALALAAQIPLPAASLAQLRGLLEGARASRG